MINIDKLILSDGNYIKSDDFLNVIYDNEGSYTSNDEEINFISDDSEISIKYSLYIEGSITEEFGDWETPGYTDVSINEFDIDIKSITIDELKVDVDNDTYNNITKLIKDVV